MSKEKKKKDKKGKKSNGSAAVGTLKTLAQNPLVAEVVAAALVATAAALKDPKKARKLAEDTSDQVGKLTAKTTQSGNVFWNLAMDVGRSALDALSDEAQANARNAVKALKAAKKAK